MKFLRVLLVGVVLSMSGCMVPIAAIAVAAAVAAAAIVVVATHKASPLETVSADSNAKIAVKNASPEKKALIQKHRYVAVKTFRTEKAKGAASVMVFDTQTQKIVGENVYDLKTEPKDGSVGKFDTVSAVYVGAEENNP